MLGVTLNKMRYNLNFSITILLITLFSFTPLNADDDEKKLTTVQLILSSELTIKKLLKNNEIENFDNYISNCRGILIFPDVYEGSFFFGAKGGNGLLLLRKSKDEFSGPFFYSIGGLSVGLQFGIKSGRVVMAIMTNRGLKSILKERVKFGVDVDVAVINKGVGYSAESTLRLADIYSFSDNSGLFLGGSLEGSYLQPRNDLNMAMYGKKFSSNEIMQHTKPRKEISDLVKIISNIKNDLPKK